MPGEKLDSEARDMVAKLLGYFNQEKFNGSPLLPLNAVQERVSQALRISVSTVRRISRETQRPIGYQYTPAISGTKYGRRKKKKTEDLLDPVKMEIRNIILYMYSQKKRVTLKSLKEEVDRRKTINISTMSLYRIFQHIGFRYKKQQDNRKALMEKGNFASQRGMFLRKYKENKNSDNKQVVFLDETCIFAKDNKNKSWKDTGCQFMVLHAGSCDGFINNACLIYPITSKLADKGINCNIFIKWVKEKLVPNLEKPSLIVMDDAPHHNMLVKKQPSPTVLECASYYSLFPEGRPKPSWSKIQIIKWLKDNNIPLQGNEFKTELLMLAKGHSKPINKYVVDEYLGQHGHEVLRLPSYHCQFNAIELIWEQAKGYYDTYIEGEGLGDDKVLVTWQKSLETCTPEVWASAVQQTETLIDTWFNREQVLDDVSEFIIDVDYDNSDGDSTCSETE